MQVGDFFHGRYIIERVLGQGGMGTVYLARNINTDTYWAIKELHEIGGQNACLAAEPKLLKKLEHPALPRLFDILRQDGKLYMIYDYINGVSLDKKLEEEGKIAEEIVVDWAIQLCRALEYLHSIKPNPVIYRDMKPSNIILTSNGTLKLIDFGIAREYKPHSGVDTVYIGTRGYAAPEQYGAGQTSAASDIYSLGVTLHQLLTGENPAEATTGLKPVRYYDETISPVLEAIIMKCTAECIEDRYESASALLADLEKLRKKRDLKIEDDKSAEMADGFSHVPYSFRRLVITVWDNAEFGCELAYAAARFTNSSVLLADLDLLAPKADLFLNLKKYAPRPLQSGIYGHSGLDVVMDAISKGVLTAAILKQAASIRKDVKNLHVITGNYRLDNYEYYSEDSVPILIDRCYRNYDITILLVNRFIYDAFTVAALLRSDINIVAIRGDVDRLREFNTYITFLNEKQNLSPDSTKFVIFEYDKSCSMSLAEIKEATRGNLIGKVSASRKRTMYRNMKSAYASHMEKSIADEYIHILNKLGIMPVSGVMRKPGFLAGRLIRMTGAARRRSAD